MKKRIITDEQLKVMFWYVSELMYCCATPAEAKENDLEYDWDIRTMFTDLSLHVGGYDGENIMNNEWFKKQYTIIKKCYDEHNH